MTEEPALKRGPRSAHARLRRLLVMLPWLMEREQTAVSEVAERFQLTERDVVGDLERVAMCGLPPYGPGDLIDLFIDEGVIHIGQRQFLTRPLRLTAHEGFALLVAGRAALQMPGGELVDSLRSALDKLATALGDGAIEVDIVAPPFTEAITNAAEAGDELAITYWSPTTEQVTKRVVHPYQVFNDRGHWYVVAYDISRNDTRTFRVDRIESSERTGATFSQPAETPDQAPWFSDAEDLPRVTLRLEPSARWVAERYPVESLNEVSRVAGGGAAADTVAVSLAVTSEQWLQRVMLRAGPGASVVEPASWRMVGADAAVTLLARYRSTNRSS